MPEIVTVRGNRIRWPRLCVSCCTEKRLKERPLRIAAMDGAVTPEERKEIDPAYATVSWTYCVCRSCLNADSGGKIKWKYIDIAALALPIAAIGVAAVNLTDSILPISIGLVSASYLICRGIAILLKRRRISRRSKPLPGGAFLRCRMIYDKHGREILGFDNFLQLLRKGEVTCEFEFVSSAYAATFRQRNTIFNKSVSSLPTTAVSDRR